MRFTQRQRAAAAALALVAVSGCAAGTPLTPSSTTNPTPGSGVNLAPQIVSLTATSTRIEIGEEVTLTANVQDIDSAAEALVYQWRATAGAIIGTGPIVKWKAPTTDPTPSTYVIALTVLDRGVFGGLAFENRATADSPSIIVDNSPKTIQTISEQFLRDFADSSVSPDTCLRNFSDSCRGKESERRDIVRNREVYFILSSKVNVTRVTVNTARTQGEVLASCEFTSRIKATNTIEVAKGTCELDLINENNRWWLCNSSYHGSNPAGLRFIF